jgi:hypothetical protein
MTIEPQYYLVDIEWESASSLRLKPPHRLFGAIFLLLRLVYFLS